MENSFLPNDTLSFFTKKYALFSISAVTTISFLRCFTFVIVCYHSIDGKHNAPERLSTVYDNTNIFCEVIYFRLLWNNIIYKKRISQEKIT